MSNKVYDILKYVVQYILPGLSTLYFAIANIWDLPYAEQVIGTIAAITTFLGITLGISTKKYNSSDEYRDGTVKFSAEPDENDELDYEMTINTPFEELKDKQIISLRVDRE